MTVYLVDTHILINALNEKRGHKALLYRLVGQGYRLASCSVILGELFSGIKPPDLPQVEQLISLLAWYAASPVIARRAGRLRYDWARQGKMLTLTDTLIAATALEYGLTLITDNGKHFPMPDLALYPAP
jgi:hypothetical protein